MKQIRHLKTMQRWALSSKRSGVRVALVPTMGFLHAGHISLIQRARKSVGIHGKVVVSIYVNPTQFGANEDFSAYPRDLKSDLSICKHEGVDLVFMPNDASMYPGKEEGEYSTYIKESNLSSCMEGKSRPNHFKGVTTVVCKLFMLTLPDFAIFGAKDYQQAAIIRRMTSNLNLPVKIITAPTIREKDGLAMSSRNAYLSSEQRKQATILIKTIKEAKRIVRNTPGNNIKTQKIYSLLEAHLLKNKLARLDYMAFFDSNTLQPHHSVKTGTHIALAVFFGKTRLIDNARL
ncbi:MAG: pantoate--beta-alanine ligase [Verrucomicrobia bacterium]|jgi:pantoate--beta-alanine ligase|nr:pantoate--beta-alanine ligase [Verrucomicrobiota bacterium]